MFSIPCFLVRKINRDAPLAVKVPNFFMQIMQSFTASGFVVIVRNLRELSTIILNIDPGYYNIRNRNGSTVIRS